MRAGRAGKLLTHPAKRAVAVIATAAMLILANPSIGQSDLIGEVTIAEGQVSSFRGNHFSPLSNNRFGSGDVIGTDSAGFANVTLRDTDLVRVGPGARLLVEAVRTESSTGLSSMDFPSLAPDMQQSGETNSSELPIGGAPPAGAPPTEASAPDLSSPATVSDGLRLELQQGGILFDRPDDAEPTPVIIETAFGTLETTDAEFFAGPEGDGFAVFVANGSVDVTAGGKTVTLEDGEGVLIAKKGETPGPIAVWGQPRIQAAYASLGLDEVPLAQ